MACVNVQFNVKWLNNDLTTSFAKFPTFKYLHNLATDLTKNTSNFFPQNVTKDELISLYSL